MRLRDGDGGTPSELGESGKGGIELRMSYEKGETRGGRQEAGRDGEDAGEAFDGAEGDYVEDLGEVFGAGVLYIDVRQCKGAGDFAEEGGFPVVGFDESQRYVRGPEFDGDSWEAGTGTQVGYVNVFYHRGHRGITGE